MDLPLLELLDAPVLSPDITGMVHRGDPSTSRDAAVRVARHCSELHERVLAAFGRFGPMTDEELEELPEFADLGPSTIRKRRSELYHDGALIAVGEKVNSRGCTMVVWQIR
jgi:hypothetical protein